MKIIKTSILLLLLNGFAFGQTTADFESFNLPDESFLNNAGATNGFNDGNIFLPNNYQSSSQSWSGWSISNTSDTETPGFTNQYSAITGAGFDNSENYALSYSLGEIKLQLTGTAAGKPMTGMYITNSTYAYQSMANGDAFAKRFGGITGNDPDFFLLTIRKYYAGNLSEESIEFYLADFRFGDNTQDYIINDWTYIDLSVLGRVDSLSFSLSSSDNGQFGMNTPAYFCADNIETSDGTVHTQTINTKNTVSVFPNPAQDFIILKNAPFANKTGYSIFDLTGKVLHRGVYEYGEKIRTDFLATGTYFIKTENGIWAKFLKIVN